jgi:hypothetical protein
MELWKLLVILVIVCALGTFSLFAGWRKPIRKYLNNISTNVDRYVKRNWQAQYRDPMIFYPRKSHLQHVTWDEGFSGGFGVGFNGGFGVGANGGFGNAIEPNFGSVGVDDKKNTRVETFYGGGHGGGGRGGGRGGGGHGGGGRGGGGRGGGRGGGWTGPAGYNGPNSGNWRGWSGGGTGGNWGWYGWSYPWGWYGPVKFAVECYSDADCSKKEFCGNNGYCMGIPRNRYRS